MKDGCHSLIDAIEMDFVQTPAATSTQGKQETAEMLNRPSRKSVDTLVSMLLLHEPGGCLR